jgi:proteasome lid subunit RPN8/RPN11
MQIKGIASDTLNFILETSKSMAPEEFIGLLQENDGIITEVIVLPGTESSEQNAVIKLFMMPNVKAAGSIHSHPGPNYKPSKADLRFFSKTGNCHIIVFYSYDRQSWKCYDNEGNIKELQVLDVKFADFEEANLDGANFEGANLEGIDFKKANLEEADLERTDLVGTNLEGTDLVGANP